MERNAAWGPLWRILVMALVVVAWGCGGSTALGAQTHAFDPVLSLTGGCTTSSLDPVPDPSEPPCPEGSHPPAQFALPQSVTTDFYGDIYVSNFGNQSAQGTAGRIDVFDPNGFFLTEIPDATGPGAAAVDSKGNLYVSDHAPGVTRLVRFVPATYKPAEGEIAYEEVPIVVTENMGNGVHSIAIDPVDDHLFVHYATKIVEFGTAAEENPVVDEFGEETLGEAGEGASVAVDAAHNRLYVSDRSSFFVGIVRVFELSAPHKLLKTFDGSATPAGKFSKQLAIAADEGTGHFFVYDGSGEGSGVVHEFTAEGELVSTISYGIKASDYIKIAIDNGPKSPNGALNPEGRYLFVPSGVSGIGHSLAYEPFNKCPPVVQSTSFTEVTRTDAELRGTVDPCNEPTSYVFEYTTERRFEEEGFTGATVAGEGQIPSEGTEVEVTSPVAKLEPGTTYRFRLVATNELGSDDGAGKFTTYPSAEPVSACPNDMLRTGLSALLPDCRAYELVTPPDTNARVPYGLDHLGSYFTTRESSPTGDKVSFQIEGGAIPGMEGTGSYGGDPYLSTRTSNGWTTALAGPTGSESPALLPGSVSPDQGYSFWSTGSEEGSAVVEGDSVTSYVRYPDGQSELLGRGTLGSDPRARGKLISENGGHIIFTTGEAVGTEPLQLEESAPPDGTRAIYDRTSDEITHVVSLLPGNVTPAGGENAFYEGASLDGKGVAFKFGTNSGAGPLYLRYDDQKTFEVAEEATFVGISEGGNRIFYLKGGNLFRFDAKSEETVPFSSTGDVTVVNLSADGSAAVFVSPSVLTKEANPNGAVAELGKENLYLSKEGTISFIGTLLEEDVVEQAGIGLGLWVPYVSFYGQRGSDPSRTTADGGVLLFESRAALTNYEPSGHVEIYRYDSTSSELTCLSCSPTGEPATGNASLQSIATAKGLPEPFSSYAWVTNLRADGRRAFFQSTEPLVVGDTDGLQDVYEWEAQGVGTCERPEGCIHLISSGHSLRADYLYAVSDSGNDVFFRSSDLLVHADQDETPSIYDARVDGGFPEPESSSCGVTQPCSSSAPPVPSLATPGSRNVGPPKGILRKCPKGKRKVKLDGKAHCVKRHHRRHHRKAGSSRGVGK